MRLLKLLLPLLLFSACEALVEKEGYLGGRCHIDGSCEKGLHCEKLERSYATMYICEPDTNPNNRWEK